MPDLEDLICEWSETEYHLKEDQLIDKNNMQPMNADMQKRVETIISRNLKTEHNLQTEYKSKFRFRKKKRILLVLAATFLFGMTVFAGEKKEWDIALFNAMGIDGTDTVQLQDGMVEIAKSVTSGGVTMEVVNSIGDKNSAYIRVDTDYKLPEDFNEKTDYILADNWTMNIMDKKTNRVCDYGSTFEYINQNGCLSFIITISNCKDLNQKKIELVIADLYLYHDLLEVPDKEKRKESLLVKGEWKFDWEYRYQSKVQTYYPFKLVQSGGDKCLITNIEISPITIRVEAIKNPTKGTTESAKLLIRKITMKDGSVLFFDEHATSGGCRNNMFLNGYRDVIEMGDAIDPKEVYSITIGDTNIILKGL